MKLQDRIRAFLKTYAGTTEEGDYTSPDAYQLEAAAELLEQGKKLNDMPWSEWGSGGYRPYTSETGRKEHESILKALRKAL